MHVICRSMCKCQGDTVVLTHVYTMLRSATHNDLVDGDENQLDKKANEAHDHESSCCPRADLVEFLPIGLGASVHEPDAVLGEFLQGRDQSGLHAAMALLGLMTGAQAQLRRKTHNECVLMLQRERRCCTGSMWVIKLIWLVYRLVSAYCDV